MNPSVFDVAVTGGNLRVHLAEPAQRRSPIVLCLHGWTLDGSSFERQLALVDQGIPVAYFDRRGCGENTLPPDFDLEVEDVHDVIKALGDPCVLYGVSQGGRLALRAMASAPETTAGLILQGALIDGYVVSDSAENAIPIEHYRALIRNGDRSQFQREWLQHPLMSCGADFSDRAHLARMVERYNGSDLLRGAETKTNWQVPEQLKTVKPPLLTMTGEYETESRRKHADLACEVADGTAVNIAGGGHLCNFTHARQVNASLAAWLLSTYTGF